MLLATLSENQAHRDTGREIPDKIAGSNHTCSTSGHFGYAKINPCTAETWVGLLSLAWKRHRCLSPKPASSMLMGTQGMTSAPSLFFLLGSRVKSCMCVCVYVCVCVSVYMGLYMSVYMCPCVHFLSMSLCVYMSLCVPVACMCGGWCAQCWCSHGPVLQWGALGSRFWRYGRDDIGWGTVRCWLFLPFPNWLCSGWISGPSLPPSSWWVVPLNHRAGITNPGPTFLCITFSRCYFVLFFFFISSGLGLQRLEAGLWFPGQRLRLGHSSDRILATKPVVSNKALGFQLCIKRIPTEMESSETNKVLIRRKKRVQYIWTDTQTDSERVPESCPHGSLNHFYGAFLLVFLWWIILTCLVQSTYLIYLMVLPCVHMHLLAKMDCTAEAYS